MSIDRMEILQRLYTHLDDIRKQYSDYARQSGTARLFLSRHMCAHADEFKGRVELFVPRLFLEHTQLREDFLYRLRMIQFYSVSRDGIVSDRWDEGEIKSKSLLDSMKEQLEFLDVATGTRADVRVSGLTAEINQHPERIDRTEQHGPSSLGAVPVVHFNFYNNNNSYALSNQSQVQIQQQMQSLHEEVIASIIQLSDGERERAQKLYDEGIKKELEKPKPQWKTVLNNTGEFLDSFEKVASPLMKMIGAALGFHAGG